MKRRALSDSAIGEDFESSALVQNVVNRTDSVSRYEEKWVGLNP